MEIHKTNRCSIILFIMVLVTTTYIYVFNTVNNSNVMRAEFETGETSAVTETESYIIYNSKCRIPDLDPFNADGVLNFRKHEYVKCRSKDLLTYIENNGSVAVIYINQTVEPLYATPRTTCRLSYVSRITDLTIKYSKYVEFESGTVLKGNTIVVKCYNKWTEEEVYSNVHAVAVLDEEMKKRVSPNAQKPNILLIGIDSVSRLNFHRALPKTHKLLQENDFIEYEGYNKIDDNTFPNLMAILTGKNFSALVKECNPYKKHLDECDILWDHFRKSGYLTAYSEDETWLNTFNYLKKGFDKKPTDFFYLPYMIAAEQLWTTVLDLRSYCAGPESSVERVLNSAKDFAFALKDYPKFGLFWTITSSHDYLSAVSRVDEAYFQFFRELRDGNVFDNTIVVFFSDHGLRFGNILLSRTGWLEERLPFLFVSIPKSFQKTSPKHYENLKGNTKKLTSPYDLHLTLKDVLKLYDKNYHPNRSESCPTCHSFFEEIPEIRSCEEASIEIHWCTCTAYKSIYNPNIPLTQKAVSFILNDLNERMLSNELISSSCTLLNENKIISASISQNNNDWYKKNDTYILVVFTTIPDTILQATVSYRFGNDGEVSFKLQGGISRLDFYKFSSQCIDNWEFKAYCYCKWNQLLDMNFFNFWFEV